MLLALLQPLSGLHLSLWEGGNGLSQTEIDAIEEQNMQTTMSTIAATIARTVEQRAGQEGFDCSIHVTMATDADGMLQIDRVTVQYSAADAARLDALQTIVTEECGVPAERQELIAK